jgi:4-amino-4-deoxy-L-arabinose transferase-like glycosyltransferase
MTPPRRGIAIAGCLLLVALAARIGVVLATPNVEPRNDGADYIRHAASIAAGHGYPPSAIASDHRPTAYRPPGWPYLLGGVFAVTGKHVTTARIAQAVIGTIAVGLAGLVALELWGTGVALVTVGLAAIYPPLAVGASGLLSEPLFVVLELAALIALLRFRSSGRPTYAAAAGALAGLAILTRTNGVLLLLPLALAGWGRPIRSAASARAPALLLACAALTIAPWTVRNAVSMDRFIPVASQGGITLAGTYNDTSRTDPRFPAAWRPPNFDPAYAAIIARTHANGEPAVNDALGDAARRYASDRPGYVAEVGWRNLPRVFGLGGTDYNRQATADELGLGSRWSDLVTYGFFAFAALAAIGCLSMAARRAPLWVWAIPVLMIAGTLLITASPRFRQPADPFVVMLAALALTGLWPRLRAPRASPRRSGPSS